MSKPYVRLDKDNAAVLLVDHQAGLSSLVRDMNPDQFRNNVLALSALEEGYEVFVVTDASGTFNGVTRHLAWDRMSAAGAQLMTWFCVACELHRDWRNDIEGLGALFANHIPDYRNLFNSYTTVQNSK